MATSSSGFGSHGFGTNPFGGADWAEDATWKLIPEFYRRDDSRLRGRVANPLRGFINSIKPSINELKESFDNFTSLWDADNIPIDYIEKLAYNLGITSSKDKDEIFQRLEILNSAQLFRLKGTDKGYKIAASFEGLTVDIIPLWAENCSPNVLLYETGPTQFIPSFDEVAADTVKADTVFNNEFDYWPVTLHPTRVIGELFFDSTALDLFPLDSSNSFSAPRCRSYKLRLSLYKPDNSEIEDYDAVSKRAVSFLNKMRPMHVEFDRITFDGPKAAAYWSTTIDSDNKSVSYYSSDITGLLGSASYYSVDLNANVV